MKSTINSFAVDERRFLADCRWIALALGKPEPIYGNNVETNGLIYEAEFIRIEAGLFTQEMTIVRKKMGFAGKDHLLVENPVVYIDEHGQIYRWHGEAVHLFSIARQLVRAGITEEFELVR